MSHRNELLGGKLNLSDDTTGIVDAISLNASLSTQTENEFDALSSAESDGSQTSLNPVFQDSINRSKLSQNNISKQQLKAPTEDNLCYSSGSEYDSDAVDSIDERERQTKEFIEWTRGFNNDTLQADSFEYDEVGDEFRLEDDVVDVDAQVEQSYRQQEMDWFASHANARDTGTAFADSFNNTDNILSQMGSAVFNDVQGSSSKSISFQTDRPSAEGDLKRNHNLSAALEYFQQDSDKSLLGKNVVPPPRPSTDHHPAPPSPIRMAKRRKPLITTPYSECVMVPRPLFFGPVLPTRVVEEAKRLVASVCSQTSSGGRLLSSSASLPSPNASHSSSLEKRDGGDLYLGDIHNRKVPSSMSTTTFTEQDATTYIQLPPQYKNFQDSIEVYGFGIGRSIFSPPSQKDNNDSTAVAAAAMDEGNPYITLFEPVWGDRARLEREDRIRSKQSATDVSDKSNTTEIPTNSSESKNINSNEFSFYARAESDVGISRKIALPGDELVGETFSPSNAYASMKRTPRSLNQSEWKKCIGMNDNISKALLSLEPESSAHRSSSFTADETVGEATALAANSWKIPSEDERPLTNLELTGGLVPLYACEDSALPAAADLGLYDYQGCDDQVNHMVQTRAQEFIQSHVMPDVFGLLACPLCAHSDDSGRTNTPFVSSINVHNDNGPWPLASSINTALHQSSEPYAASHPQDQSQVIKQSEDTSILPNPSGGPEDLIRDEHVTINGWWNTFDDNVSANKVPSDQGDSHPLIIHPGNVDRIHTCVGPTPSELLRSNRSLSELHPATSILKYMPLLSDRNPFTGYIQISTEAIACLPMGEIEPFFCSLAIWNIDKGNSIDLSLTQVTESLHFDFLMDKKLEELWSPILNPYSTYSTPDDSERPSPSSDMCNFSAHKSRCGMFPIPSSLSFSSLYAILLVRRVLSNDDEIRGLYIDEGPTKKGLRGGKNDKINFWREKTFHAAKCNLIQSPFAFGILPLAEAIGSDNPTSPTTRTLEIQLLHADESDLHQQICTYLALRSHLSQAETRWNVRGVARMVTSIHKSLNGRTLPSRPLVDFSGELYARRRDAGKRSTSIDDDGGRILLGKSWFDDCTGEPIPKSSSSTKCERPHESSQDSIVELASLLSHEPCFHTAFINELVCRPIKLQNSSQGPTFLKIEVVKIKWDSDLSRYVVLKSSDPMIHNPRRGPLLVDEICTSCIQGSQLNDEFKIKLPSALMDSNSGVTCILVSAYSCRKRTDTNHVAFFSSKLLRTHRGARDGIDQTKRGDEVIFLGCGFLPLSTTTDDDVSCLLKNGLHQIELNYWARSAHADSKSNLVDSIRSSNDKSYPVEPDRLILEEMKEHSTPANSVLSQQTTNGVSDGKQSYHEIDNTLVVEVLIFAISSVFSQNMTISRLLQHNPNRPHFLNAREFGPWCLPRDDLIAYIQPEKISQLISVDGMISEDVKTLTRDLVDFVNFERCSMVDVAKHCTRIFPCLLRSFVSGVGEFSILWCNPSSPLPLRLQAFASILYVIHSLQKVVADHPTVRREFGNNASYILCLLFDEESIFLPGTHNHEDVSDLAKQINSCQRRSSDFLQKPPSTADTSFMTNEIPCASSNGKPLSTDIIGSQRLHNGNRLTIDSKSEFQAALKANTLEDDEIILTKSESSHQSAQSVGGSASNRRRWMTVPSSVLSTIQEDVDRSELDDERSGSASRNIDKIGAMEPAVSDYVPLFSDQHARTSNIDFGVKQMRVPSKHSAADNIGDSTSTNLVTKTMPLNENDLEAAGDSFLDSLGFKTSPYEVNDKTIGLAHHRKTRSRCSIDWTLPPTDDLLENQQHLERMIREDNSTLSAPKEIKSDASSDCVQTMDSNTGMLQKQSESLSLYQNDCNLNLERDSIITESSSSTLSIQLPGFIDRLVALGKNQNKGRWFPYMYEVVVFQWIAILREQSRLVMVQRADDLDTEEMNYGRRCLSDTATLTRGWTIECAPTLFQMIKKSLGWRIDSVFRQQRVFFGDDINFSVPMVTLDVTFECALENLIQMITDACIDSRNFDSQVLFTACLEVNDSIVRFLRDLFSLVDSSFVQRLLIIYFSRFNTTDGKFWRDHESTIGLHTSCEVFKMQLNAITLLVRFADFIGVNKEMAPSWFAWPLNAPALVTNSFFDSILQQLMHSELFEVVSADGPSKNDALPKFFSKPHWLSNIVLQACTLAMGHDDESIKIRGASIIYELLCRLSHLGRLKGNSSVFACMFFPLLRTLIVQTELLSTLPVKGQIRRKLLTCLIFVLQSAPVGLMRAQWRALFKSSDGSGNSSKSSVWRGDIASPLQHSDDTPNKHERFMLSVFGLLNLCLKTLEYERVENTVPDDSQRFLLTINGDGFGHEENTYTTDACRTWHSHDSSVVVINTCRLIVREALSLLRGRKRTESSTITKENDVDDSSEDILNFSTDDSIAFTKGASSVYLTSISLNQSDSVYIKAIVASVEIVKVFGFEIFASAVGETMQHWMRMILWLCGARRKELRISALDFLALLLRLSWDSFGSFSIIRIPLLSVISEVMERQIVNATHRAIRNSKDIFQQSSLLPIECAEAALSPLWISLDRLHRKSSSRNVAFKAAVEHLACSMKVLYRACIASHAVLITQNVDLIRFNENTLLQVNRIVAASAGLSRQYLGNILLHKELIEEAFHEASEEYSSSEMPLHRIQYLLKLVTLHQHYGAFAEEAFCRYEVHSTWGKVATLCSKNSFSFPVPFLPWLEEDKYTGQKKYFISPHYMEDSFIEDIGDLYDTIKQRGPILQLIRHRSAKANCFTGIGDGNLFYGVCPSSQYDTSPPLISTKEVEGEMIEEAERSADCFRRATLIENSRLMMNHATYHSTKIHDYEKLAYLYTKQAFTVCSESPSIDPSLLFELSSEYGRFYRVWFHGNSLPDDLMGAEFIYRTDNIVKLDEFSKYITQLMSSVLPDNTPIDVLIDDGRPEEPRKHQPRRLAASLSRDPVKIKITAVRPIMAHDSCKGSSVWFHDMIGQLLNHTSSTPASDTQEDFVMTNSSSRHRKNSRSSISSSSFISRVDRMDEGSVPVNYPSAGNHPRDEHITGVRKFSFTQPLQKDRHIGSRNWFKASAHNFGERSLRVTELLVGANFPCCVTRQRVSYRSVYIQSPLEAGIEATCLWCSVLYRTIISINGQTVTGSHNVDQGIGKGAVKIVAECIHRSNVRDIAQLFLQKQPSSGLFSEDQRTSNNSNDRLSDNEVHTSQLKLARAVVLMMELLHLLIGRNRDILLTIVKDRKRQPDTQLMNVSVPLGRLPALGADIMRENSLDAMSMASAMDQRTDSARTDSAITVQRELQRSLISLVRAVIQPISEILQEETPPWLRLCCSESYFSSKGYRRLNLLTLSSEVKFVDGNFMSNHRKEEERYLSRTGPISLSVSIPPVRSDDESTGSNRRSISPQGSFAGDSYHSRISRSSSRH